MTVYKKIPVYSICSLIGSNEKQTDLLAIGLSRFLTENTNIIFPHRHDFYQLLYITKGGGQHVIDFVTYPVDAGYFYFLSPGMMHTWAFEGDTEGYLINFTGSFFQSVFRNESFLSDFPFFHSINNAPFLQINTQTKQTILPILIDILTEYEHRSPFFDTLIRAHLTRLFVLLSRAYTPQTVLTASYNNISLVREFEKLVDAYYLDKRFPRDYAPILSITPSYLNEVCVETVGKSAGQIIRERVILEIKRLLVHSKSTISEIAYQLNFEDNAYFSRFFKKYTNLTPEKFRQQTAKS
ncbi:MAG: helix-turn-helix domain-containing protein [Saprospiraceae bacterium]|nr:helix-turn-helix domain-containing protein [Saprospiraceae bacterium]